jgi:hypothetical protein
LPKKKRFAKELREILDLIEKSNSMELITYILKSSALLAVFYLAYQFLVQKETFFNTNRWFLLSGLFASLLLPLVTIKK